jgi:Thioesterase-like superfamily
MPSEYTRGPWSPDAQHGGPPAALMGHLIQRHENGDEMLLARTTVELLRPVPLTPLFASVRTTRAGRKVQLVEASLWTGASAGEGIEVVRAVGLRVRRSDLSLPAETVHANDTLDDATTQAHGSIGRPEDGEEWGEIERPGFTDRGFHAEAVELRFIRGAAGRIGPGTMWGRLLLPLLDDVAAEGVPLALALSDFGNATSSILPAEGWRFLNADLTVSLHREPVGPWICLDAITRVSSLGIGIASAELHDLSGPIGRSAATLLIEPR